MRWVGNFTPCRWPVWVIADHRDHHASQVHAVTLLGIMDRDRQGQDDDGERCCSLPRNKVISQHDEHLAVALLDGDDVGEEWPELPTQLLSKVSRSNYIW